MSKLGDFLCGKTISEEDVRGVCVKKYPGQPFTGIEESDKTHHVVWEWSPEQVLVITDHEVPADWMSQQDIRLIREFHKIKVDKAEGEH